jgi:hypothetical protein
MSLFSCCTQSEDVPELEAREMVGQQNNGTAAGGVELR